MRVLRITEVDLKTTTSTRVSQQGLFRDDNILKEEKAQNFFAGCLKHLMENVLKSPRTHSIQREQFKLDTVQVSNSVSSPLLDLPG